MTAGRSAAHRRKNQPGRCGNYDERCNLKQAHDGLLSYARPKFWDSARVAKLALNQIIASWCFRRAVRASEPCADLCVALCSTGAALGGLVIPHPSLDGWWGRKSESWSIAASYPWPCRSAHKLRYPYRGSAF